MKNYISRTHILSAIVLFILLAGASFFALPYFTTHADTFADSFIVEEYANGSWQTVASAPFPGQPYPEYRYTTKTFTLPVPSDRIRIIHTGGTQIAHLDQVVLGGMAPVSAADLSDNSPLPVQKFASADYDVINNWDRTIELSWNTKNSSLTVAGVAEGLKGVPYLWPAAGYNVYTVGDTKTYTFAQVPVSSHPFATRYAYASTDGKNLIVNVDWTSDNTLDSGKDCANSTIDTSKDCDWAELGVVTKDGLKTFLIFAGEKSKWGTEDFTYTSKVSWQHEVFTFSIPLSQIGASHNKSVQFQIRYYGTDGGGGAGGGGDGGGGAGGGGDGGGGAGGGGSGGGGAGGAAPAGGGGPAPVIGCMDPSALNYNPSATDQTGITCTYPVFGCMDSTATNYNPAATSQAGITCTYPPVCILTTNPTTITLGQSTALSWGFSSNVTSLSIDNGIGVKTTRSFSSVSPTMTTTYNGVASSPNGSATCSASVTVIVPAAPVSGCTNPSATNYNPSATVDNGSCTFPAAPIFGCMDKTATNYNPAATSQTGITCTYPAAPVSGCTNPSATNYNPSATVDNGSCTFPAAPVFGCMDSTATNYNPAATSQTGVTCTYPAAPVIGCMDSTATNYNPAATSQTGATCTYLPTCTLSASPASIVAGNTSTLAWTTTRATTFTINNGVGAVTPVAAGTSSVSPAATVTYTGTATGPGGSVTCAAAVTVTAAPPPPNAPTCALSASPASIFAGSSSTLSWTTANAATFSIDNGIGSVTPVATGTSPVSPGGTTTYTGTATGPGGSVTCAATIQVSSGGGAGGGGGGGGGGAGGGSAPAPVITLAALAHVGSQPLAFLYLSQIPYTGLDLGPVGTFVYWVVLIGVALVAAYFVLFSAVPLASRSLREFGSRVAVVLNAQESALSNQQLVMQAAGMPASPVVAREPHIVVPAAEATPAPEAPRGYSTYDGFKSFAHNGALSVEDIVKSLSRHHPAPVTPRVEPVYENVEPVYDRVEPVYEKVEPVAPVSDTPAAPAPASTRGFAAALLEGDRAAVFAGLRQHVRGNGAPEKLVSDIVCLLDDAYRARIDGTSCDADIARLSARLSTPTLEKLIAALTTAIDSSYSEGVTGAKLALTRALSVLGA